MFNSRHKPNKIINKSNNCSQDVLVLLEYWRNYSSTNTVCIISSLNFPKIAWPHLNCFLFATATLLPRSIRRNEVQFQGACHTTQKVHSGTYALRSNSSHCVCAIGSGVVRRLKKLLEYVPIYMEGLYCSSESTVATLIVDKHEISKATLLN